MASGNPGKFPFMYLEPLDNGGCKGEPPRLSRRLQVLRGWGHEVLEAPSRACRKHALSEHSITSKEQGSFPRVRRYTGSVKGDLSCMDFNRAAPPPA